MAMSFSPLLTIVLLGVSGAVVGSFVGLVSLRLPAGEPVALARSRCGGCHRRLRPTELIPLVGFVARRGRCATCHTTIPWRYPATETAAVAIGVAGALLLPLPEAAAAAILGWTLLLLAILDLEHFWLPSAITASLAATGLVATVLLAPAAVPGHLFGAVAGYASLALVAASYKAVRRRTGLGRGDARLFAAAGAWLGWQALPLVLALASLGGLFAALLVWRRGLTATTRLPFGTCLAPAIWAAYLLG